MFRWKIPAGTNDDDENGEEKGHGQEHVMTTHAPLRDGAATARRPCFAAMEKQARPKEETVASLSRTDNLRPCPGKDAPIEPLPLLSEFGESNGS